MTTTHADSTSITGLAAADHSAGSAQAELVLLEYGDFECPSCAEAEPYTRHLVEAFGGRMRFVFRHYPPVESHAHAELAAEAAEAAAAQGKFWEMHHLLFAHQKHLARDLTRHAEAIGLDMQRFSAEMADRIYTQRVQEHRRSSEQLGLRASPSFSLNGALIDVSFGSDHLERAIRTVLGDSATKLPKQFGHERRTDHAAFGRDCVGVKRSSGIPAADARADRAPAANGRALHVA